jgi:DNA-binding NarL/FixJ family response regulator
MDGLSYREIAEEFSVSFHTVHDQVKAIYRKSGVRSARQFVALARDPL